MRKKTILHIIYNLGRGGAETMLVQVLKKLTAYHNIVVTLEESNHFKEEMQCDEYICLQQPKLLSFPLAAIKLRKLINSKEIDIVHSHLPMANFTARLAVPSKIRLITTIHNSIATSGDYKKWFLRFIDRTTFYLRSSTIIAVSKIAMEDYFRVLQIKNKSAILLYNFVDTSIYSGQIDSNNGDIFKAICVGALSKQKNISFLISGITLLKDENIVLHVYGQGQLQQALQNLIDSNQANVVLKGQVTNIAASLPKYDLFVMSSLFEGFSLSVLEAMAAGLPLLLSDIPSFREQCGEHALYFDLNDPEDFAKKMLLLQSDKNLRNKMAAEGQAYVNNHFTIEKHIKSLVAVYENNS